MIVGAYTLHLYCDNDPRAHAATGAAPDTCRAPLDSRVRRGPAEYSGASEAAAKKEARAAGWWVGGFRCYCPYCKGPRPPSRALKTR